ncbi:MAG: hypothetical protein U0667_07910 [Chloroflexota bacterium]
MPPHLFAYLDLASGSMIIQAAIAGLVAVPILLRNQIRRVLGRGAGADHDIDEQASHATADLQAQTHLDGSETSRP